MFPTYSLHLPQNKLRTINTAIHLSGQHEWPHFGPRVLDLPFTYTYNNLPHHRRPCTTLSFPSAKEINPIPEFITVSPHLIDKKICPFWFWKILSNSLQQTQTLQEPSVMGLAVRGGLLGKADWRLWVFITFPFCTVKTTLMCNSLKIF